MQYGRIGSEDVTRPSNEHPLLQRLVLIDHSRNVTPVLRSSYLFWCGNKTGVMRILIIFQGKLMFCYISGKLGAFELHA